MHNGTENVRYRGDKSDRARWKACAALLGVKFVDFTYEAMEAHYRAKCVDLTKSTNQQQQQKGK